MPRSRRLTSAEPTGDKKLANRRYALVILRLLLDEDCQLVQGEVVDEAGQVQGRFRDWNSMAAAVRRWFADYRDRHPPEPP